MLSLVVLLCITFSVQANDYEKAWEALSRNDHKTAKEYLLKAIKDPATATDAYLTYLYVISFEGREDAETGFMEHIPGKVDDVNPYIYALWFNDAVLGAYGKKSKKYQLQLLDKIMEGAEYNGSLRSAAHYVKAMHLLYSTEYDKAKKEYGKMGSITQWQLTGPFDNLSGSGFYKSPGPLQHPEAGAEFRSLTNAGITWFTPEKLCDDGWIFINTHIPYSTAVCYAQSFVYAPEDMDVLVNAGVSGSVKVWVNDALAISEAREYVTELDYYKSRCHLRKGYNRVLVQLGITNNSTGNFIIRFTDTKLEPVAGLTHTSEQQAYTPDIRVGNTEPERLRHFAEDYFSKKVEAQPSNLINYILLAQTYLRNQRTFEARQTVQAALKLAPNNSLIRFELMQCFIKDGNRTLLSQELEWLKENDPHCYLADKLNYERLINEEKYEEAQELLTGMISSYGEGAEMMEDKISLLGKQEKMEDALKEIQRAYKNYPENLNFVGMMYRLRKQAYKDASGAAGIYERYLKNNFNYSLQKDLAYDYIELGKKEKGIRGLNELKSMFPYDADLLSELATYYFQQQDYKQSLEYNAAALRLAPYVSSYWENGGIILQQMGRTGEAAEYFNKALYYDTKRYETRKKLRVLEKKQDLYKVFPETDYYDLVRKSAGKKVSTDHDYVYLLDERQTILYAEGANEQYITSVIRINTEKGIDQWKEAYIPYNEYTQTLLIEKAEVVKKNGSKLTAEQNGNEMVFTSLEVGDAVLFKYRLQNYARGRLARDFWDIFHMGAFEPSDLCRYSLLVDKNVSIDYKMANAKIDPVIKEIEGYKLYTWEIKDQEAIKSEAFMPSLADVSPVLHVSTIRSWNDIAEWYSDISRTQTNSEYELKEAYKEIFPGQEKLSELEKAKRIYNYIEKNIRYSSVSFRQSAYVPQKASTTLNTRLGDCKDLSSLFVALAEMAGLKANMVLVETRDEGSKETFLPAVEFNHCIVLLKAGGKDYYLELTDNDLPFGSLPSTVIGASSLVIPSQSGKGEKADLKPVLSPGRTRDRASRTIDLSIDATDIKIKSTIVKTGSLTTDIRSYYANLSPEKQKEDIEKSLSDGFKNPLKVEAVSFTDLDQLLDSVKYQLSYKIQNEVIEVGDMQMFKVPYMDVVATLDNFSADTRRFPVEYWRYEDTDEYETTVNITIPAGKKIVEVPADQNLSFNKCSYSIKFIRKGTDKLTIIRKARLDREVIQSSDYAAMKKFFSDIVKIESKYIAFK